MEIIPKIEIVDREDDDRIWLKATSQLYRVECMQPLPATFYELSEEKRNYWIKKITEQCAREMKSMINQRKRDSAKQKTSQQEVQT